MPIIHSERMMPGNAAMQIAPPKAPLLAASRSWSMHHV